MTFRSETRTLNIEEKDMIRSKKECIKEYIDNKVICIKCGVWDKYSRLLDRTKQI
jgi:hypothetical protein